MLRPASTTTVLEVQNTSGCYIKDSKGKGRGVYASRAIQAQAVIEISPILFFTKEEYEAHGKYTVLDHYTFKCRDGRMALALGIGSIFNHSDTPNVSYIIDVSSRSIRFTTTRLIDPGEELCIFYGQTLWFEPVEALLRGTVNDSGLGGSSMAENQVEDVNVRHDQYPFLNVKSSI